MLDLFRRITTQSRQASYLLAITSVYVLAGMAYSFWWPPLVRHRTFYWLIPHDIWLTVRDSHWIAWGGLSSVYSAGTSLITLPGYSIVLLPVVLLSSGLNLSEGSPPLHVLIGHQTAWLIVGPFMLASVGPALFALNALAVELHLSQGRRRILTLAAAAAMWPTIAIWGHPEDVLAFAFVVYALLAAYRGRTTRAAWLFGIAAALQLWVVMLLPIALGLAGVRRTIPFLLRAAVIPGFFFFAVVIPDPTTSLRILVDQPLYPGVNHPTPWELVAPHLADHHVAGGLGHLIALAAAILAGIWVAKRQPRLDRVLWLSAVVLVLRCEFEAVMIPYFVMPAAVLLLLLAAYRGLGHLAALSVLVLGLLCMVQTHHDMWNYWLLMTGILGACLVIARPPVSADRPITLDTGSDATTIGPIRAIT